MAEFNAGSSAPISGGSADASLRIGVVSDTHGHVENTRAAVRRLAELDVKLVLHCGDIGSAAIVPLFAAWQTHFVFGNVDHNAHELQEAILNAGQTCHGRFGEVTALGTRIALLHSDDIALFKQTIDSREWDIVCYGHTHVAEHHLQDETLVLNPGALYRATPHSIATVELPTRRVTHFSV